MTCRELMKWILDNKYEDYRVEVRYRNDHTDFPGTTDRLYLQTEKGKEIDPEIGVYVKYKKVIL